MSEDDREGFFIEARHTVRVDESEFSRKFSGHVLSFDWRDQADRVGEIIADVIHTLDFCRVSLIIANIVDALRDRGELDDGMTIEHIDELCDVSRKIIEGFSALDKSRENGHP